MTRLPGLEVTQILSRDPRSVEPYKVEVMRRMLQDVRPNAPEEPLRLLAKSLNEQARKKFICFQSWVCAEFEEKGCVEVPDEFIRDREESQKGQEGQIQIDDPHLPADKYFTTVYNKDDNAEEKLVFSFTKKRKADSDYVDSGEDEDEDSDEESDEDEEESESDDESDEDDD